MMLQITGAYAAALTGLFLLLTVQVIAYRRSRGINLGDGDDEVMVRLMRAQGNFVETAPLGILLLAIAEMQGEAALWLHLMGGMLLVGRLMHGINFTYGLKRMPLRVGGMALTLIALTLGAGLCLPF